MTQPFSTQPKLQFFTSFPQKTFASKQTIITDTQPITSIYYLKKGHVKQFTFTPSGDKFTIHIFKPQSYFPILLALTDTTNKYQFQTLDKTIVHQAPVKAVKEWLTQNPEELSQLTQNFASGIVGLTTRLENALYATALPKVASLLVYFSQQFGENTSDNQVIIKHHFSHEDIASWLGLTRETITRQIDNMKKQDLIKYEGRKLIINDLTKLKTYNHK